MELWDVLDINGQKTGKTVQRGNGVLDEGEFHLVVHLWLVNSDGEFLIQKRSSSRETSPGLWDITGGSAVVGESSIETLLRETEEELGVLLDLEKIPNPIRWVHADRGGIVDIYFVQQDVPIEQFKPCPVEVEAVRWETSPKIKQMISDGTFWSADSRYFEVLAPYIDLR